MLLFHDPVLLFHFVLFAVLGLVIGSFGNVLICRVPERESILGRSHCPHCKHKLSAWELIPVVSFLALGCKCRKCGHAISWQYPLIELATSVLFVLAFVREMNAPLSALALAFALWMLLIMAMIDAHTSFLPDALNIPFVIVAVIYGFLHPPFDFSGLLLCGGLFLIQWLASRGRWIGSGDVILGTGIGALLGSWQLTALFLFFTYVSGGFVAAILILKRKKTLESHLAFGPFLTGSAVLCALFGNQILELVQQFMLHSPFLSF